MSGGSDCDNQFLSHEAMYEGVLSAYYIWRGGVGRGGEGREILTPTTGYRGNNTVLKEVILQLFTQQLVKLWS